MRGVSVRAVVADLEQQIRAAAALQSPGDWSALLWEMDARAELHRVLQCNSAEGRNKHVHGK